MIDTYTRLLEAVAETEDKQIADTAVTRLIAHLKSSGRMNMLPKIVRELRKVAARRQALSPRIEVAHAADSESALSAAREFGIGAERTQVNKSLVRGWRAQGGGKLVDRSAKSALIQIYQKVTA